MLTSQKCNVTNHGFALRNIIKKKKKKKHESEDMKELEWSCEFYPPKQVFLDFKSAKTPQFPRGVLPLDPTWGTKNFWFVNQIMIILLLSIIEHNSGICGVIIFFVYPKGGLSLF